MTTNIQGIDKITLLKELWKNSNTASFFADLHAEPPKFDKLKAAVAITNYIDYFQGRSIKSDISQDTANSGGYDRDMGLGSFDSCVNKLRTN